MPDNASRPLSSGSSDPNRSEQPQQPRGSGFGRIRIDPRAMWSWAAAVAAALIFLWASSGTALHHFAIGILLSVLVLLVLLLIVEVIWQALEPVLDPPRPA